MRSGPRFERGCLRNIRAANARKAEQLAGSNGASRLSINQYDMSMMTSLPLILPAVDEAAIGELERGLPGGSLWGALRTFADELEKRRGKLIELHASADGTELAALAHGLKGSASTFCAPALAQAAKELEDKLRAQDLDELDDAVGRLSAEVGRAIDYLHRMMASRGLERS